LGSRQPYCGKVGLAGCAQVRIRRKGERVMKEANRRHMFSFDAIVLKEADHFLMMDRPEEFNHALEKAIHKILGKTFK
jgi:hypothetical protein